MKLTDLNPNWVKRGGDGIRDKDGNLVPQKDKIGMIFDCPCGCCVRPVVLFENNGWTRDCDDFEKMTISPSVYQPKEKGGCGWHGWVRNGEIISL